MDEQEYWSALEIRLCKEFLGMPERRMRYWWCDGFLPERYFLDPPEPKITGHAYICNGASQELWQFTLFLGRPYVSPQAIDWPAHLPPDNVTCWIAIAESEKAIQIEPFAAKPDFPISN